MAGFIVEAMVRGIHELVRMHNFLVLVENREKPQKLSTLKIERYTVLTCILAYRVQQ